MFDDAKHLLKTILPTIAYSLSICWMFLALVMTPRISTIYLPIPLAFTGIAVVILIATTPLDEYPFLQPKTPSRFRFKRQIHAGIERAGQFILRLAHATKKHTTLTQRRYLTNFAVCLLVLALAIAGLNYLVASIPVFAAGFFWLREMRRQQTLGFVYDRVREISEERMQASLEEIENERKKDRDPYPRR